MLLRESKFSGTANFDMVLEMSKGAMVSDESGCRSEFVSLVKTAKLLDKK